MVKQNTVLVLGQRLALCNSKPGLKCDRNLNVLVLWGTRDAGRGGGVRGGRDYNSKH